MTAVNTTLHPDSQAAMTTNAASVTERLVQLAKCLKDEVGVVEEAIGTIEQRVDHLIGTPPTTDRGTGEPEQSPDSPLDEIGQNIRRLATQRERLLYYAARL